MMRTVIAHPISPVLFTDDEDFLNTSLEEMEEDEFNDNDYDYTDEEDKRSYIDSPFHDGIIDNIEDYDEELDEEDELYDEDIESAIDYDDYDE